MLFPASSLYLTCFVLIQLYSFFRGIKTGCCPIRCGLKVQKIIKNQVSWSKRVRTCVAALHSRMITYSEDYYPSNIPKLDGRICIQTQQMPFLLQSICFIDIELSIDRCIIMAKPFLYWEMKSVRSFLLGFRAKLDPPPFFSLMYDWVALRIISISYVISKWPGQLLNLWRFGQGGWTPGSSASFEWC